MRNVRIRTPRHILIIAEETLECVLKSALAMQLRFAWLSNWTAESGRFLAFLCLPRLFQWHPVLPGLRLVEIGGQTS